jgi:Niemann-Pick C1 protein
MLRDVCGPGWPIPDTVCCTKDQINTLRTSLQQAEPLIASCPACRNNFRAYHCSFTCSPDQSLFLDVVQTQKTDTSEAIKEINYYVSEDLKQGFYSSCKDVQFGATNGFAMDLIGGGAKNASGFLKFMGDERPGLGSPFQISIPDTRPGQDIPKEIQPLDFSPLDCSANELAARCTCIDCPKVCPTLPYVSPPRDSNSPSCTVGAVSCLTFSALILYSVAILLALSAYSWKLSVRHRQRRYERVALLGDPPLASPAATSGNQFDGTNSYSHHNLPSSSPTSPGIDVGSESARNAMIADGDHPGNGRTSRPDPDASSGPSHSSRFRLGRGASLLDPIDQLQPRQNHLNIALRGFFYRLGWRCATYPGKSTYHQRYTNPY